MPDVPHRSSVDAGSNPIDVAQIAAKTGGDSLLACFGGDLSVRSKGGVDLVSQADVEAETAIVDVIRQAFPDHAILGEESHAADVAADRLWVVDPLDGTTNFLHGIPHFAVSIAYYQRGEPVCGVVFNPARGEWYEAVRGQGATFRRDIESEGTSLAVSPAESLCEVLVGVGFYYDRGAMMEATLAAVKEVFERQVHGIRRFGTAALDLCQVACGNFGAYFEYQLSPWDFAAGRLIVEEAGGQVTTCRGDALPLSQTTILASNGRLHAEMLKIVKRHVLLTSKEDG